MFALLETVTDAPSVIVADGFHDGKPQSVAALVLRCTVEAVEDMFRLEGRFVRSVADAHAAFADAYGNDTVSIAVSHGINYQVVQQAFQQNPVCIHPYRFFMVVSLYASVSRYTFKCRQKTVNERVESYTFLGVKLVVVYFCQK